MRDDLTPAERREVRAVKLLGVITSDSPTAGEKANACDALAVMFRAYPETAEVAFLSEYDDDDEFAPWYANLTLEDVRGLAFKAEQLAEIATDWTRKRRKRGRGPRE